MNSRLKNWLIEQFEKTPTNEQQNFLRILKRQPDKITNFISVHLLEWGTTVAFEDGSGPLAIYSIQEESAELTKFFQKHFAKELEAVQ